MGLRDVTTEAPGPTTTSAARCDLHGVGHARSASAARFGGFFLAVVGAMAFLVAARPASAQEGGPRPATTALTIGTGLSVLGASGFVVGQLIERRTRYHVWLQCEARAVTDADVGALVDAATELRGRVDATWAPDQLWIVGAAVEPGTRALARERGVRCFVMRGAQVDEV